MKRLYIIKVLIFCSILAFAQEGQKVAASKNKRQDQLLLNLNWTTLLNTSDSVQISPASWGFGFKIMLDNPVPNSKFAFALGLGLNTKSLYSNSNIVNYYQVGDSVNLYSDFFPIEDGINFKRNKFNTVYIDIPAELRYRTSLNERGYSWNLAVGGSVGYLIGAKSKSIIEGIKYKAFDYPNIEDWAVGIHARIGYGKVALNAAYSLSSIFEQNRGSVYNPFSVGVTISPF